MDNGSWTITLGIRFCIAALFLNKIKVCVVVLWILQDPHKLYSTTCSPVIWCHVVVNIIKVPKELNFFNHNRLTFYFQQVYFLNIVSILNQEEVDLKDIQIYIKFTWNKNPLKKILSKVVSFSDKQSILFVETIGQIKVFGKRFHLKLRICLDFCKTFCQDYIHTTPAIGMLSLINRGTENKKTWFNFQMSFVFSTLIIRHVLLSIANLFGSSNIVSNIKHNCSSSTFNCPLCL